MSEYPECDKLSGHKEEWEAIYPFIEWLQSTDHPEGRRYCVAFWMTEKDATDEETGKYRDWYREHPYPYPKTIQDLLYEYFGVDPAKLEVERRAVLERQRQLNRKDGAPSPVAG